METLKRPDDQTDKLIDWFKMVNLGRAVDTITFGILDEQIILAALAWGIKKGEIEFFWQRRRPVKEKGIRVATDPATKKVRVELDTEYLDTLEQGIAQFMPGNYVPSLGTFEYVIDHLRKNERYDPSAIPVWNQLKDMVIAIYHHYRAL